MTRPTPSRPRYPWRPAKELQQMTIAAGFVSKHGALLCADSQESVEGLHKSEVFKVKTHHIQGGVFGFVAAGQSTLGDALEQELAQRIQKVKVSLDSIEAIMRATCLEFFNRHIRPNPAQPQVAALMLLHVTEGTRLFRLSIDSSITRHDDYATVGIGSYVADQWIKVMLPFGCDAVELTPLATIATGILWHVKKNVDGCGDMTMVSVYPTGGEWRGFRSPALIEITEEAFRSIHWAYGYLLHSLAEPLTADIPGKVAMFADATARSIVPVNEFHRRQDEMTGALLKKLATKQAQKSPKHGRKVRPPSRA